MIGPSTAQFQGDPVRVARRAHDEIRLAEAERVERVCAALREMPGLTDEAAQMFARTILDHPDKLHGKRSFANDPAPNKLHRLNPFRRGNNS